MDLSGAKLTCPSSSPPMLEVTMNAASKTTVNLFGPQIYNIACLSPDRTADISISDANGNLLAVLYNMDNQTRYKVIDVSTFPWGYADASGNNLVDVLFKVRLHS